MKNRILRAASISVILVMILALTLVASAYTVTVPDDWKTDETAASYVSQYTDTDDSHLVVAAGGGSISTVDTDDTVMNSIFKEITYELMPSMKLYATEYTDLISGEITTTYSYYPVEIGHQGYTDDTVQWVATSESQLYEDGDYMLSEEGEQYADEWYPMTTLIPPVYIRKVSGIKSGELTLQALGWSCGLSDGQLMPEAMYLLQNAYIEVANYDSVAGTFTKMEQVPVSDENGVFTVNFACYDYLVIVGAGLLQAYAEGPAVYSTNYAPDQLLTRDVPIATAGELEVLIPPIDILPEDATVITNYVWSGEAYDAVKSAIKKASRGVKEYRVITMDLIGADGTILHELTGDVIGSFIPPTEMQLPTGYHYQVYRLEDDGVTLTMCATTLRDGRVYFMTNHFSVYVLAINPDSGTVISPDTGEP